MSLILKINFSYSSIDCGFKLIDVYNLTKGVDGFSNRKFHIDLTHLHPKTLEKIKIN